jgi:hypothetical protein
VRQTRIRKHRNRPAAWKQTPQLLDPSDPDIVKAHQLTRNPIPRLTDQRGRREPPSDIARTRRRAGRGHHGSLASLFRQIGNDERVHKLDSLASLQAPRPHQAHEAG